MKKNILITGGAGFIGSNLCDKLLKDNHNIICIDNFDDYYNPLIKRKNISSALNNKNFKLIEGDITELDNLNLNNQKFDIIVHLAAKAGVRYSLLNPEGYEESNIIGTRAVLNFAVKNNIKKVIYASSSSIYGNCNPPFKENYEDLNPISPYAKTKLFSEKMGKQYSEKYGIDFISLRFFSVYGPRLRPDLVMNKIAKALFNDEKLKIFGDGYSARDYTYIDDIIQGIIKAIESKSIKGFEIFNLGNGQPIELNKIIEIFETITGKTIPVKYEDPIQGESNITWADNSKAKEILNFKPKTNIYQGIINYLNWYKANC